MTRYLLLALLVSTPAFAQRRESLPAATRPKIIATPTPAPAKPVPVKPAVVKPAAATPAPATPAPRKRPAPKPVSPTVAYLPKVKAAFAKRWAEAVQPHMEEFVQGNVSVKFKLDAEGKLADFTVTENTSNEAFAKFCEGFVRETEFEKPPTKALAGGLLEIPFTFWIY
jgi:hypothetical protein